MLTLNKLTEAEKNALTKGVVQVYGKAMNRTALGIIDAFFVLNPNATFSELKEAFPDSINPSGPVQVKTLFAPFNKNRLYGVCQPGSIRDEYKENGLVIEASHFIGENETFTTSDGTEVLVSRLWESKDTSTGENDLQNLINHAEKHGIRVVKTEPKTAFKKGSYQLEIINPVLFEKMTEKQPLQASTKSSKKNTTWLLIILLVAAAITAYIMTKK